MVGSKISDFWLIPGLQERSDLADIKITKGMVLFRETFRANVIGLLSLCARFGAVSIFQKFVI